MELASIHLDAMTGDTQAQAQAHASPIVASLLELEKQIFGISVR